MKFTTERGTYALIPQVGLLVNSELENEIRNKLPQNLDLDDTRIADFLKEKISFDDMRGLLSSVNAISFNVTEDCNFRCKYCAYSGKYNYIRTHRKKYMSFDTANRGVDFYLELINDERRAIKRNQFSIAFYGGEPLLAFDLMKRVTEYGLKKYRELKLDRRLKLKYRFTTNGYLLTSEVVPFFVRNNFIIDVSLDGPEEEHNKFRITKNKEKTWDVIIKNLKEIKRVYPEFYKDNIRFICTLHPDHCFKEIEDFFLNNPEMFEKDKITMNWVMMTLLKEKYRKIFLKNYKKQVSKILKQIENKTTEQKFNYVLNYQTQFTGQCFPGETKTLIDTDGSFYICERAKSRISLGDVFKGFNYENINRIWNEWREEVIRLKCWKCDFWFFCNRCMAQCYLPDKIVIDCVNRNIEKNKIHSFLQYKEDELKDDENKTILTSIDYLNHLK